jgi:hypothetical protein
VTSPLQSLTGGVAAPLAEARFAARRTEARSALPRRWLPTSSSRFAVIPASKLAVLPVPPLPRSWSVLQGLTHPASGSSVHRSGSDLRPLDRGPCRLHRVRFPVPVTVPVCSPRALLPLPRSSGPSALPSSRPVREGTIRSSGSSPEVCCPSSARGPKRPLLATLPQPLRSDLAVSHDLAGFLRFAPSRFLSGWHSWGLPALQGPSRSGGKLAVPGVLLPS